MKRLLFFSIFFIKASLAQTIEWVNEYPLTHAGGEYTDMELDSLGNIFLTGHKYTYHGGPRISRLYKVGPDATILVSDTSHVQRWRSVNVSGGSIYTEGTELTQRDANGNIMSQQPLPWLPPYNAETVDGEILNSILYGIYFGDLIKYDLSGNQIWLRSVGTGKTHLQISVSVSHIFVLSNFSGIGLRILKYDPLGNLIWNKPAGCNAYNICVDETSNCYVFGHNMVPQGVVIKLDENGDPVWTVTSDDVSLKNGTVYNDTVYACGGIISPDGSATDDERIGTLTKLSAATGHLYSSEGFNFFSGVCSDEFFTHVLVNSTGIYLGGWYCGEVRNGFVVKLSSSTLTSTIENSCDVQFNVYPSPTSSNLAVEYFSEKKSPFWLKIYSPAGKLIYNDHVANFQGQYNKSIDLSGYAKGIYSVEILAGKKKESRKIVLQ